MTAEMGTRPIDDRLWNVIDTTVRRLPSARDKDGVSTKELERIESENQASSRSGKEGAEDASRTISKLRDKIITYSQDFRPARDVGDGEGSVDVKG